MTTKADVEWAKATEDYFSTVDFLVQEYDPEQKDAPLLDWIANQKATWMNQATTPAKRIDVAAAIMTRLVSDAKGEKSFLVGEVMLTVTQLLVAALYQGSGSTSVQILLLLRLVVLFVQKPGETWVSLFSEVIVLLATYVMDSNTFVAALIFSVMRLSLPAFAEAVVRINQRVRYGSWWNTAQVPDGGVQ